MGVFKRCGIVAALLVAVLAMPALARAAGPHGVVVHLKGAAPASGIAAPAARSASPGFTDSPPITGAMTYHQGHVMGGGGTITVHTVYWNPGGLGLSYPSGYGSLIDQFVGDVAAESGTTSNVFASDTQYTDKFTGHIQYNLDFAGSRSDTDPVVGPSNPRFTDDPTTSCDVTGVSYCVTDPQIAAELSTYLTTNSMTPGYNDLYVLLLPPNVGVCFGQRDPSLGDICSTNVFCAYHGWSNATNNPEVDGPGYLYAVEPYFANGDQGCSAGQSPNNNDGDVAINTISHEMNEAITDPSAGPPNTKGGWYDVHGNENGDKCAWGFGARVGNNGNGDFNQIINGHDYFLQREWSNASSGCYQFGKPTIASFSSNHVPVSQTVGITGANFFFANGTTPRVLFNGHASPGVVVDSPTHLTVTVPNVAGTTGKITVKAAGGTVISSQVFGATPTVTLISATSGHAGDKITVTGTGFFGVTAVKFDGVKGVSSSVAANGTSLKVTVPAAATDGNVTVTTSGGTSSESNGFAVLPKITSFTPAAAAGGASVTINGSGFATANEVDFGSATSTSFVSISAIKIVVRTPNDATSGHIVVKTNAGTTSSAPSSATFKALPKITSFTPADGQAGSSTTVTITGTNFLNASAVKFGTTTLSPSDYTVDSATQITASSPASFSTGRVTVVTPNGTSVSTTSFSVTKVTSSSPVSAAAGATVTITGQGLGSTTSVDFVNHTGVVPTSTAATWVKVAVPVDAMVGALTVHTPRASVTTAASFKPLPKLTAFDSSNIAQAGDSVTIFGTNLDPGTGALTVKLGAVAMTLLSHSSTAITVVVPATGVTGLVTLKNADGTATSPVKLLVVPTITGDPSPNEATTGTPIALSGATFTGTKSVAFGNNAKATFVVSNGGTTLTVKVPATATSGLITVTNAGGSTLTSDAFTVDPKITGFTPASAPTGAKITITGTGFGGATSVNFNGTTSSELSSVTPTSLKVVVPAGAATGHLSIHTAAGDSAASTATFTVSLGISSLSPAVQGYSHTVEITGTGFTSLATGAVKFNGVSVPFHVDSAVQLTATLPASGTLTGPVTLKKGTVTVQSPQDFTVFALSTVSPASAAPGGSVTITGTGFTAATDVTFNGVAATSFDTDSDTQISAEVPNGFTGGASSVVVTITGGATSSGDLTLLQISSLASSHAVPGDSIQINGTGFTGATDVQFGGVSASSITVDSDTVLHATVPVDAPASSTVTVIGPGGSASKGPFTVDYATVELNEFAPNLGGGTGLIELKVLDSGSLAGIGLSYVPNADDFHPIGSLPSVTVTAGDLIVLHLNTAGTNETSKTSCVAIAPACYPGAWDFFSGTGLPLPFEDLYLELDGPSTFDAVPFVADATPGSDYLAALASLQATSNGWSPSDCGGAACTNASTPTAAQVSVDWSGVGTDPSGNTIQRTGGDGAIDSNAYWALAPSTLGAAN